MNQLNTKLSVLCIIASAIFNQAAHAQGNYVFSGGEAVNFGTIDLSTPGGQTWATDRAALPGYFSAVNGASFTGASDAANIDGYVKKYGNEAFTFPVGSGTDLRTLSISAPSAATDAYATAWIVGDPGGNLDPTGPNAGAHPVTSKTSPILSVSPVGQWDWQAGVTMPNGETGTGAGLTITVSIPDMSAFGLAVNLRLVGWNGTAWEDLSGGPTASGNTENSTLSGTMKAGITAIAIGSTSFILPVKLETFTAAASQCTAVLNWTTGTESGYTTFEIQFSTDGVSFTTIHRMAAKGVSGSKYNYAVPQESGTGYYRLKMLEPTGAAEYSKILAVRTACNGKDYIRIFPNPVTTGSGTITVSFSTAYRGTAQFFVTNAAGQLMTRMQVQVSNSSNAAQFNTAKFASGVYYIRMADKEGKEIFPAMQFVKQ